MSPVTVGKDAYRDEDAYLLHVFAGILLDLVRGTPGAAMYHGIKRPLIEGNVDGLVGNGAHVSYVHVLPFYPLYVLVTSRHEINNHSGKVDAELPLVPSRRKFNGDNLVGEWTGQTQDRVPMGKGKRGRAMRHCS